MWQSSFQSWVRDVHGLFTTPIASAGNYSLIKCQKPCSSILLYPENLQWTMWSNCLPFLYLNSQKAQGWKTEGTSYWSLHEPWNFPLVPKTAKDFIGCAAEKGKSRISLYMYDYFIYPSKITVSLPMFLLFNLTKLFPLDIRPSSKLLSAKWSQGISGPNKGSDDKKDDASFSSWNCVKH